MRRYKNLGGGSGVVAYEIGEDSITVRFRDGSNYLYTYQTPGKKLVERMKELAEAGQGLHGYISKTVKKRFESKTR
jgi:hypothetical protein